MNKSELKKEIQKSRIRTLQKVQYSAFFLMLVEVVIWAATDSVYAYVPVEVIEQIIEKHGGWFDSRIPFA